MGSNVEREAALPGYHHTTGEQNGAEELSDILKLENNSKRHLTYTARDGCVGTDAHPRRVRVLSAEVEAARQEVAPTDADGRPAVDGGVHPCAVPGRV